MKTADKVLTIGGVLVMLLVGLHIAVIALNYKMIKQNNPAGVERDYFMKIYDQPSAFVLVGAGLTFFISLFLLLNVCKSPRMRIILTTINLVFEFSIGVLISIIISTLSINRQFYIKNFNYDPLQYNSQYKTIYNLLMADAIITFTFEVVFLAIFYYSTLQHVPNALPEETQMTQMDQNSPQIVRPNQSAPRQLLMT